MSRRWTVRLDRTRCDGNWALDGMHVIPDLTLPDLLLVFVIFRWTGIDMHITRDTDTREDMAA